MPIPLGILAAAGFRPAAAGSYELIETITVTGTSTSSITFNNLNTYSSTYQHLQIRASIRANDTTGLTYARLNGDSGNNYSWHWLGGDSSSIFSNSGGSFNSWFGYASAKTNESAGYFSAIIMDILDAYESKNKTLRVFSAVPGNLATGLTLHGGAWYNTAAVSSVTIFPNSTTWIEGSRFSIYGLKGA